MGAWVPSGTTSDEADDVVHAVLDPGKIGKNQVNAWLAFLGEKDTAVHDEELTPVLKDVHVTADLAQTSQRSDTHGTVSKGAGGLQHGKVRHAGILQRVPR